jgi:predicted O-linked N-acetylglucosamine transferase (SPINDLY family)
MRAQTKGSTLEPATDDELQTALAQHQAGRLAQAEALYRKILAREPRHPDALHFLGVMAQQVGKLDLAVDLMQQSIRANPRNQTYFCNLGCALQQQGKASEAAAALSQSLALDPNSAEAHYNLGLALHDLGRADEAVASYRRAIVLKPDYAEAYGNLGYALYGQGRTAEAIASYRRALRIRLNYPEAHYNLGNALFRDGALDEATASYRSAIAGRPGYADAHNNLGNALKSQGKLDEAIASYTEAIKINPASAEMYVNLGIALHQQRRFDEAIAAYRSGLAAGVGSPELHFTLGNALQETGNLDDAVASYREAIRTKPAYAEAYSNLGRALQEQARIDDAAAAYEKALELKPEFAQAFSNLIYLHAFAHDISPEEQLTIAGKWECAALSAEQRAAARRRTFARAPREGRKLRLGVVSAELGQHAVAEFLQPLLEQLDRSRFHLTLYPTVERADPRAAQLKELADHFASLAQLSDGDAAELVRSDCIDVLMDTTGHTNDCRLGIFAHRAAPVQCSYIGFWATTGLTEMDWYITNQSFPPSCDSQFRERLWRMPRQANAYHGDASLPESTWSPSPDGTIWLGSFNKYSKIREHSLALWATALHALPEAKLLLEDRTPFDGQLHPRILAELERHGIAAGRVEFSPFVAGWGRHMLLYDRLDIALDTVPFNSGTTAFDALWMGVPLVALEGDWGGGRMGSGVLTGLGRTEWIAHGEAEYAAIVSGLARDVEARTQMRKAQRARMAASPLCDRAGLARDLEDAFVAMFDDWTRTKSSQ